MVTFGRFPAGARGRAVLAVGTAALAAAVLGPVPADAGLTPGTGWTAATLPSGFIIGDGNDGAPQSPMSCVPGTEYCVAIITDQAVTNQNGLIGQGSVVSTNGGKNWSGFGTLPSAIWVLAISCPSTSECWVAGTGPDDQPEAAESVDGGQTWTSRIPDTWTGAGATWWPNSIDCISESVCWVAGMSSDSSYNPAAAETTDGGATWTTFTNLPAGPPHTGPGTYILGGISCVSAVYCVAVGGYPFANGTAIVLTTTDGGATWSVSPDPTLAGLEYLVSVSCVPGSGGLAQCGAVGTALQAAGPVEIMSADGGTTWSGVETYDSVGRLNSISCADAQHCWAAGAYTPVALVGTADGGATWSQENSGTIDQDGSVSCSSATFCVASVDSALWTTSDDGGLGAGTARASRSGVLGRAGGLSPAGKQVARPLPQVSPANVWVRTGRSTTIVGQYRGTQAATFATAVIQPPNASRIRERVRIGLNEYYSVTVRNVKAGTTTVTFTAGNAAKRVVRVHGHTGPAPTVTGLSAHAGPSGGGNLITVTGTNFRRVTAVRFGAKAGARIRVRSATRLTVRVPAGVSVRYVTVVTAAGGPSRLTGRAAYNYLPAPRVTALSPSTGPKSGGTKVTISGTNLAYVKAVYFGAHRASRLIVLSARRIRVVDPAGTGTVNVRVVTLGGASIAGPGARFTY